MRQDKYPVALLINDIHVGKDNISEFHKNWNEALEIASKMKIEDIVIGGDLWQARSGQNLDTLLAVRSAIKKTQEAGIYLTIAEGNHDLVDQEALLGYSHIFDGYDKVNVIGEYDVIGFAADVDLYVMSYFPENGTFTERLARIVEENKIKTSKTYNILYVHQGIRGGLGQATEDELPTSIFQDFDAVLVGHYHDRKLIPGTNIEYIGSSRQHNFGEDEEKGYTILFSDGSTEFIKNEVNTRYKVIEVDYNHVDADFLDMISQLSEDPRYKLKVKVKCDQADAANVSKEKMLEAGAVKVEVVKEAIEVAKTNSQDLEQKFDKLGIKHEYENFCSDKAISPKMGMKYLDLIS